MKILACLLSCFLAVFGNLAAAASRTADDNLFIFLSVRIKGNGDGTITAVAQNEFAICNSDFPVVLTLYSSKTYVANVERMEQVESITNYDLNIFETITINYEVTEERYFCAAAYYIVNGDLNKQQTDIICYDTNGKRV